MGEEALKMSKTEIIAAAGQLFSTKGYHGTSMREIAATSGIRPGSLYQHIDCKEELLWEIVNAAMDELLALLRSIPPDLSTAARLLMLIEGHAHLLERDPASIAILWHDARFLQHPTWLNQFRRKRHAYQTALYEIIKAGISEASAPAACSMIERALLLTFFSP
jgi:AcrR family transcriptional regulator